MSGEIDAQTRRGRPAARSGKDARAEENASKGESGEKTDKAEKKVEAREPAENRGTERAAGAAATKGAGPEVIEERESGDGGVKTYKFGPVEVEGRLKSPQVVYFLRRVRAEFAAGQLGHRSFMRELSDTRRNPALK